MSKRLKKLLLALYFAGIASVCTLPMQELKAAQLGPVPSPTCSDPSQMQYCLNLLTSNVNNGVSGVVSVLSTAITTSGTGANAILSYTFGANTTIPGNIIHVRIFGNNDSTATDVRTITVTYGGVATAVPVTSQSNVWIVDLYLTQQTTAYNYLNGIAYVGTGLAIQNNGMSVATNVANTLAITATAATAGTMTVSGANVDIMR